MTEILLLLSGFTLGIVATLWFQDNWADVTGTEQTPDTRERVVARVLLHQARRSRQLAELEKDLEERSAQRLRRLEDNWPDGG